jgi:putative ABC transport system permease protein
MTRSHDDPMARLLPDRAEQTRSSPRISYQGKFMRLLLDILHQSLRTLWANKLRSFLTMFGIAWGVGSLLLLVGLGEGFRSGQRKNLAQLGSDIIFIFSGRIPAVEGSLASGRIYRLTYEDYLATKQQALRVRAISPVLSRPDIRASSEFNSANGQVTGVTPIYNQIRWVPIETGRWITEEDDAEHRRVAVIGHDMAKNLFSGRPVVGSMILLNGHRFEIIGLMQATSRGGNISGIDLRVFMPINTMRNLFPLKGENVTDAISYMTYQPVTRAAHQAAKDEVHQIIARRHGFDPKSKDTFEDWDTIENSRKVDSIFDAMNFFLGGVGLVTLGLGAIGIINIMLVSVSERIREIGLRKAVGATQRNILTQFFLEGAFLTALSGGVGLAAASALVYGLAQLPAPRGFDTPRIVPASAAIAIVSLCLAGVVAGLYPARKAAMLPPVEALRQE